MDIFIFRSLIFGLVEYGLALYVLRKNNFLPKLVALFLFFLGTYQIGEFIYFITKPEGFGLRIAYAATTMLPPIGLMIVERATNKKYGSKYTFLFPIAYATLFLFGPMFVKEAGVIYCFAKVIGENEMYNDYLAFWTIQYIAVLVYAMVLLVMNALRTQNKEKKKVLILGFFAYCAFFPTSVILVEVCGLDRTYTASIMCAFAILAAFILSYVSVRTDKKLLKQD